MNVKDYNKTVEQHADALYRFILKNVKEENKAKDIVQDAYEKLWVNIKAVNPKKAKSYLFSTAYHTFIDMVRREKKQVDFDAVDVSNYSHSRQYSDVQEILHKAVHQLPEDQRSVVLLRDYEGYSYKEIAEITGLTESQVKVYIYRARVFLKKFIGKMETVI